MTAAEAKEECAYLVGLVWTKHNGTSTTTALCHGIITASSKAEALGDFIIREKERHTDYSLSNSSVMQAYGYAFDEELDKKQRGDLSASRKAGG